MSTKSTREFKQALGVANTMHRRKTWEQKKSGVLFLCSVLKKVIKKGAGL